MFSSAQPDSIASASEQPPEQGCHRRLDAQDARPERYRREADALERADLPIDESSLGADGERDRLADITRALGHGSGMGDEGERVAGDRRELLLDERPEEPAHLDRRQRRVAGLFEPEDALREEVLLDNRAISNSSSRRARR